MQFLNEDDALIFEGVALRLRERGMAFFGKRMYGIFTLNARKSFSAW